MNEKLTLLVEKANQIKTKVGINFLYLIGLLPILLIGLYVRTRNLRYLKGKYLLGLDPYVFFRYAAHILEHGKMMAVDAMRYVPLGYVPSPSDVFFSYTLAFGYKLTSWLGITQMQFHIWYPVVAALIGFVFLFLFLRELFGNKVAIIATAFAAVLPAYIYRTGAGFADHEAAAMMWMFISFYLFAKAWNSEKLSRWLSFSIGSGVLAGFMVLTWGGYKFLFAAIGLLIPLTLLFTKLEKDVITRRLYAFFAWLGVATIFLYIRYESFSFVYAPEFMLLAFAALASIAYLCVEKYKNKIPKKITTSAPSGFIAVAGAGIVGAILAQIIGFSIPMLISRFFHPAQSSRLGWTISENTQPYFTGGNGWIANFGITTWLILASAILIFYFIFQGKNRYALSLSVGWTAVIASIIFGNYKAGSPINKWFSGIYVYLIVAFILALLTVYLYTYSKEQKIFDKLFNSQWQLLLVFSAFVFALIIAKRSVRMIFALAPFAAIIVGYCIVKVLTWLWQDKRRISAVLLSIFVVFCFVSNAQGSIDMSNSSGSGYPGQWESAFTWVRESTSSDAVFAHWWDYGYWTQTMGERASVVDGGNAMSWDHGMGRHGLLGRDPDNYISYLKTHDVTHLLISAEEIGKFHAFATIGADENWDLRSTIGIFNIVQTQDIRDGTKLIYGGGWALDKDYVIGNKVFKEGVDYVAGFTLDTTADGQIGNPLIILYNGANQQAMPLNCICQAGQCHKSADGGFGGCLVLLPYFNSEVDANPIGTAFYVSEKIVDTNLVQMYIIGKENPYFKEVYNDNSSLGMYQGRIIGPIKIWEVQYPEGFAVSEETKKKYLARSEYG